MSSIAEGRRAIGPSSLHRHKLKANIMANGTYYTNEHEWIRVEGDVATIGITDHAQESLGEIVFFEAKDVGSRVSAGATAAVVESVKAASDIYAPVDGEILSVNPALADTPELINGAAESEGWLFTLRLSAPAQLDALMDRGAYLASIG
jgi:glycine cleavage system H protein